MGGHRRLWDVGSLFRTLFLFLPGRKGDGSTVPAISTQRCVTMKSGGMYTYTDEWRWCWGKRSTGHFRDLCRGGENHI